MAEVALGAPVAYPESDGRPVAENSRQFWSLTDFASTLKIWFRDREDAYVGGDTLLYYVEGDPKQRIAPDVYAVFGVPGMEDLDSYRVWDVGKAPDFVLEVASPGTDRRDRVRKPRIYAQIGVSEYWRFDPDDDLLMPQLSGHRLVAGRYERLPMVVSTDGAVVSRSPVLGLDLETERFAPGERPAYGDWGLFLRDPANDERLLDHEQLAARFAAAGAERDAAIAERNAAVAENAALRAQLAALRGEDEA